MVSPTECALCRAPLCDAMVMQCNHDICIPCSKRTMVELPYARIPCAVCGKETNLESDTLLYLRNSGATCAVAPDLSLCMSPDIVQCSAGGVCHYPQTGIVVRTGSPSSPKGRGPHSARAGDAQPGSVQLFGVRGALLPGVGEVLRTNTAPMADKPRPFPARLCDCRERKCVSFWCENCRKLICPDCAVVGGSHKHHRVIPMRIATTKVQPDIEKFMAGLKNMCHEIELEICNLNRADRRVTSHLSTSQANLRQAMAEAHDKLKYVEDSVACELDKSAMFATRSIHKYRDELQTKLQVLNREGDSIIDAMGNSDDASVLHQYSELEWKARELGENGPVHREVPELPLCQKNLTIRLGEEIVGDFHILVLQHKDTRTVTFKDQKDDANLLTGNFEANIPPSARGFAPTIAPSNAAQSLAQGTVPSTPVQSFTGNAAGPPVAPVTYGQGFAQSAARPPVVPVTHAPGFAQSAGGPRVAPVTSAQGFVQSSAGPRVAPVTGAPGFVQSAAVPRVAPVTDDQGFARSAARPCAEPVSRSQGLAQHTAAQGLAQHTAAQGLAPTSYEQGMALGAGRQNVAPCTAWQSVAKSTERQSAAPWQSVASCTVGRNAAPGAAGQIMAHIAAPQNTSPNTAAQRYAPSIGGQNFTPSVGAQNYAPSVGAQNYAPSVDAQNFAPSVGAQNYAPSFGAQNFAPSVGAQNYAPSVGAQNFAPSVGAQNFAPSVGAQQFAPNSSTHVEPTVRFAPDTGAQSADANAAAQNRFARSNTAGRMADTPQSPATSITPPQAPRCTRHDHSRPCSCSPSPPCSPPHQLSINTCQITTPPQDSCAVRYSEHPLSTPSTPPTPLQRRVEPSNVQGRHISYSYHPAQFYGEDLTCGPARNEPCSEHFSPKPRGVGVKDLLPWRQTLAKPGRRRLDTIAPSNGAAAHQLLVADKRQRDRPPEERISKAASTTGDLASYHSLRRTKTTIKTRPRDRSSAGTSNLSTTFADELLALPPAGTLSTTFTDEILALPPAVSSTVADISRPSALTPPSRSSFTFPSAGLSTFTSFRTKAKSRASKSTKAMKSTKTTSGARLRVSPQNTFGNHLSQQKKTDSAPTRPSGRISIQRGRDDSTTQPDAASHRSESYNAPTRTSGRISVQRGRDDSTMQPDTASGRSESDDARTRPSGRRSFQSGRDDSTMQPDAASGRSESDDARTRPSGRSSVQRGRDDSTTQRDAASHRSESYNARTRPSGRSSVQRGRDNSTTQRDAASHRSESYDAPTRASRQRGGDESTTQYSTSSRLSKDTYSSSTGTTTRSSGETRSSYGTYESSATPSFSKHRGEETSARNETEKSKKAKRNKRERAKSGLGTYGGKMSIVRYDGGSFMDTYDEL